MAPPVLLAGAKLEHLADQHQRDDDGGGLEIDRDQAMGVGHGGGEQAGRERGDDAVEKRRAGAERDQREHIEPARAERMQSRARRTASRTTAPPGWRGASLQPLLGLRREEGQQVDAEHMGAHVEGDSASDSGSGDPQPAGKVDELRDCR